MNAARQPNPDPLRPDDDTAFWRGVAYAEREARGPLLGLVLAGLSGAIMGAVIVLLVVGVVHAAPRSAQTATPTASEPSETVTSGNPAGPSGAPSASPSLPLSAAQEVDSRSSGAPITEAELGTAMVGGTLAYAKPSFGDRYLAIPEGPGVRVRICSGKRCLDRVSNDAGPALFRQREGRIADVSYVDFAWLCRCRPESLGLLSHATIEYLGSGPGLTPPPTDVSP